MLNTIKIILSWSLYSQRLC